MSATTNHPGIIGTPVRPTRPSMSNSTSPSTTTATTTTTNPAALLSQSPSRMNQVPTSSPMKVTAGGDVGENGVEVPITTLTNQGATTPARNNNTSAAGTQQMAVPANTPMTPSMMMLAMMQQQAALQQQQQQQPASTQALAASAAVTAAAMSAGFASVLANHPVFECICETCQLYRKSLLMHHQQQGPLTPYAYPNHTNNTNSNNNSSSSSNMMNSAQMQQQMSTSPLSDYSQWYQPYMYMPGAFGAGMPFPGMENFTNNGSNSSSNNSASQSFAAAIATLQLQAAAVAAAQAQVQMQAAQLAAQQQAMYQQSMQQHHHHQQQQQTAVTYGSPNRGPNDGGTSPNGGSSRRSKQPLAALYCSTPAGPLFPPTNPTTSSTLPATLNPTALFEGATDAANGGGYGMDFGGGYNSNGVSAATIAAANATATAAAQRTLEQFCALDPAELHRVMCTPQGRSLLQAVLRLPAMDGGAAVDPSSATNDRAPNASSSAATVIMKAVSPLDLIYQAIVNHVDEVMLDPHACHVVRSVLELLSPSQLAALIPQLNETLLLNMSTMSQYTRKVVQTLFERHAALCSALHHSASPTTESSTTCAAMPSSFGTTHNGCYLQYVIGVFSKNARYLAATQQGCIALMRIFELLPSTADKMQLTETLLPMLAELACDPFGNYVVQCVLGVDGGSTSAPSSTTKASAYNHKQGQGEKDLGGAPSHYPQHFDAQVVVDYVLKALTGKFLKLTCNKFGSNAVEKLLRCDFSSAASSTTTSNLTIRKVILDELIFNSPQALTQAVSDGYGNFVIQTILETCVSVAEHRKVSEKLKPVIPLSSYGHKIEAKMKWTLNQWNHTQHHHHHQDKQLGGMSPMAMSGNSPVSNASSYSASPAPVDATAGLSPMSTGSYPYHQHASASRSPANSSSTPHHSTHRGGKHHHHQRASNPREAPVDPVYFGRQMSPPATHAPVQITI